MGRTSIFTILPGSPSARNRSTLDTYMAEAAKRSSGFLIAGVALLGLLVLSIAGIVHAWLVTRPI